MQQRLQTGEPVVVWVISSAAAVFGNGHQGLGIDLVCEVYVAFSSEFQHIPDTHTHTQTDYIITNV